MEKVELESVFMIHVVDSFKINNKNNIVIIQ